jgi:septal ring factor EnvC (AmiA/AmiB activator)
MSANFKYWISIGFALLICLSSFGQDNKKELELKKKQLQQEIELTNQLIQETKKNKNLTLAQLKVLNKKIEDRKKLINTLLSEMSLINREIQSRNQNINTMQAQLNKLKADYAKVIYKSYINRNRYNTFYYVFSADNITQAYRRLNYLQAHNNYRRKQVSEIKQNQKELSLQLSELQNNIVEKRQVLVTEEQQKKALAIEKTEQEQAVNQLKKKEKELLKELAKKKSNAKKLESEIRRVIEREIKKERERALVAKKAKKPVESKPNVGAKPKDAKPAEPEFTVSPETKLSSSKFEQNKGRLPWPINKGVISEEFGQHKHPVLANVYTFNNGVDFAAPKGTAMRAIFDGEVSGVVNIPGNNTAVIIRHGEYLSVYSNITDVEVKSGQKVKTGDVIGQLSDDESGKSTGHLEIWNGKNKMDPSVWIAR